MSKKFIRLFIKLTLLDEIIGFLYWALIIYGLFLISDYSLNPAVLGFSLTFYIIISTLLYIYGIKKIKILLRDNKGTIPN